MKSHFLFVLFFLFIANSSMAQNPELSALDIVKKAIAAAGSDWRRPQSLYLKGNADFYPNGMLSEKIHFDYYEMARVFPSKNEAAHKANGQVAFVAKEGNNTYFKLSFDGQKQNLDLSERAKPYIKNFELSNNFGFSIIRFADGEGFKLSRLADDQIDGHSCYMIHVVDPKNNQTTFGIDKESFQIRQVAFDTEIGYHHRIYSDFGWNKDKTFSNPGRIRIFYGGRKWVDIHWTEFTVNQPISEEKFK
jgi:hypothetical protein